MGYLKNYYVILIGYMDCDLQNKIEINSDLINGLSSTEADKQTFAAVELTKLNFKNEQLYEILSSADYPLKHFGILKLKKIKNQKQADILLSCLTNNESNVRESCSFKIKSFISNEQYNLFFQGDNYILDFTKAITDVNPRVCKNIIECIPFLKCKKLMCNNLIKLTQDSLEQIGSYRSNQGHKYNRLVFKLYWGLEALNYIFMDTNQTINVNIDKIIDIVKFCSKNREYTIREKAAALTLKLNQLQLLEDTKNSAKQLSEIFSKDDNFYVRLAIMS